MRSLACSALLLSSLAHAEGATRALIWGGGATPEAAATALKDFEGNGEAKQLFEFAAGYPKVVESKSIAGMKPGFHVVLLGVCGADESLLALSAFKSVQPQVYARQVQVSERNCPKLKSEWKVETKKGGPLTAIGLTGGLGAWKVLVSLTDDAGELIDFKTVSSSDCHQGAELRGFDADTQTAWVSLLCYLPGCTAPDEQEQTYTFKIVKKRLRQNVEEGRRIKGACD
jgi:hypothetical protein